MNDDQASYLKVFPARPASPIELDVIGKLLDVCNGVPKEGDRAILLCRLDSRLRANDALDSLMAW